jgi:ubiquinone/menaquinone biosynthesis C-methylase UbiE
VRDAYAELAPYYDSMAKVPAITAFYREWREALTAAIRDRGIHVRVLADLACGTGNATVPWTRRLGFRVIGVDRSAAMLRQARKKSAKVRWYRQDLTRLSLPVRVDVATCHFDALNHVLRAQDLKRIFARVSRLLREGGLLQFDLNTVHMLRWLDGRDKLVRIGQNCFTAHNELDARTGIATFHQWWFVRRGRLYERIHVVVRERAYTDRDIRAMLRRARMRLVKVTAQRRIDGKPVRKLYLAVKDGIPHASTPQARRLTASS